MGTILGSWKNWMFQMIRSIKNSLIIPTCCVDRLYNYKYCKYHIPLDVQLWNWHNHWRIWPSFAPSLSLLQVWVCWFPPAPSPRAACMRCMWRYTGRTAWGNFPASLSCCHVGTVFLCIPFSSVSRAAAFRTCLSCCEGEALWHCDKGLECSAVNHCYL